MKPIIGICLFCGGMTGFFFWLAGEGHESVALIGNCFMWGVAIVVANLMSARL